MPACLRRENSLPGCFLFRLSFQDRDDLLFTEPALSHDFPGWQKERKAMKGSRFSDAQKAFIIKQGEDGTPVAEVCRKAGIRWPAGEWNIRRWAAR